MLRRQGRGTFVVEHTPAHVLFRFFNICDEAGVPITPDSTQIHAAVVATDREERNAASARADDEVIRITRVRTREGKPFIAETIALAGQAVSGLVDLPHHPQHALRPVPEIRTAS